MSAYAEPPLRRARRWIGNHPRLSRVLGVTLLLLTATGATLAIAARQAQVLVNQARFGLLEDAVRTLEVLLETKTAGLAQDARFASELPPIQEIIRRRRPSADGAAAGPAAGAGLAPVESEEAWKGRLASIFTGLLRGHPEYRVIDYIQLDDAGARELVRCERSARPAGSSACPRGGSPSSPPAPSSKARRP